MITSSFEHLYSRMLSLKCLRNLIQTDVCQKPRNFWRSELLAMFGEPRGCSNRC